MDSVLVKYPMVYSGGERRLIVSNIDTGELLSIITRDSGEITELFISGGELYSCSSNGSIRTFEMTHTGTNIKMVMPFFDLSLCVYKVLNIFA